MVSYFLNLAAPVFQASDQPNIRKPWEESWVIDGIMIGFGVLTIILIWLWARSGRSKRENQVPFERTAEDFAGTTQAAYGRLPAFLLLLYTIVLITMAAYIVNAILTGVQY